MPVYIPNPDLKYWNSKKNRKVEEREREEEEIYAREDVGTKNIYDAVRERYEESETGAGYDSM